MFDSWLSNSTLPALEQTAVFAQKRHQLLAGNLANLDTPDYQTRDLSLTEFQSQLKAATDPSKSCAFNPAVPVAADGCVDMPSGRQMKRLAP